MRLTELEPKFVKYEGPVETYSVLDGDAATWRARGCPTKLVTDVRQHVIPVASLDEAQGIWFLCPKCFQVNKGNVGTHWCDVTFADRGARDEFGSHGEDGKPTRWNVSGSGFADLTTTPSILLKGGCAWHGFITNGEVT